MQLGSQLHTSQPLKPRQFFRYNTETVSSEVLSRMKQQISDVHSTGSHSFLLDDDATLPFAASDVLNAMDDMVSGRGGPWGGPKHGERGDRAGNRAGARSGSDLCDQLVGDTQ